MNKKKYQWIITLGVIIIMIICFIGISNSYNCYEYQDVCYKTECSFWGCKEIRVDLDSPQCETVKNECAFDNLFRW